MRISRVALQSLRGGLWCQYFRPATARTLSTNVFPGQGIGNRQGSGSFETSDDFEQRIFDGRTSGDNAKYDAFFQKLDQAEKAHGKYSGSMRGNGGSFSLDYLDNSFNTLSDGMDGKLREAAEDYDLDPVEQEFAENENYKFRPDVTFYNVPEYETKDLDMTKPGVQRTYEPDEFEVTTEEVIKKADFRNVRFLANFITEAGIIIKRSKTGISAKAQRKVAREIKTARAFGLMPFTTMGTKSFVFGETMEDGDKDFEYESFDVQMDADDGGRNIL